MVDHQLRAVGWAASFFFIACGALRLARFNVQVGAVDSRFFVGMPIPAGAACVASVILAWPAPPKSTFAAYALAIGLFAVGLLMVSTIRFPNFKKRSHHPLATMWITVGFAFLLSLLIIFRQQFFLGFFAVYILMGISLNLAWLFGWRGILPTQKVLAPADPELEDTSH